MVDGRVKLVACALWLALAAVACSDEEPSGLPTQEEAAAEDATSTTSASSSTTTTTSADVTTSSTSTTEAPIDEPTVPDPSDTEAFEAYIAGQVEMFYDLRERAFENPSADPEIDYAAFAEYSVDPQLKAMYEAIKFRFDEGVTSVEPEEPLTGTDTDDEHRTSGLISQETDEVTVFNCELNDNVAIRVETGEIVSDVVVTNLEVITLVDDGGVWKLSSIEVTQKLEGAAGCFLASEAEFPY